MISAEQAERLTQFSIEQHIEKEIATACTNKQRNVNISFPVESINKHDVQRIENLLKVNNFKYVFVGYNVPDMRINPTYMFKVSWEDVPTNFTPPSKKKTETKPAPKTSKKSAQKVKE